MRLLRLDLKAVGPFTDLTLDLSAGLQGLHLIHGPNEAGKTSTLRALSYLLFGFPLRTPDDFVHPYDQLRIGAVLRQSDGSVLEVVRRKASKNPLRGPDDSAVVPVEELDRFLGGLDRDSFETLFGIDHARLARAGDEIRSGQGRLGELLFTAGTGLAGLREAQGRLQNQLDELFKPRGQNQRINQALGELRARQEELKNVQLSSEVWQQHEQAYRSADARAGELGDRIAGRQRERNRLERIRGAVPLVARRRALRAALDGMGDVLRLRAEFGADCRATLDARQLSLHTISEAGQALEALAAQLEAIAPPGLLLDAGDAIDALTVRLGAVEKAATDRVENLEPMLAEHAHQARRLLRELGHDPDLDAAEARRLRTDEPAVIRDLAQQSAALLARRASARKAIARLADQMERLEHKQTELGQPEPIDHLRHAVRTARGAGDLDDRCDKARTAEARSEDAAALGRAQLPGWPGTLADLERLAVPLDATLDRFETALRDAENALKSLDEKQTAEGDAIGRLEAQVRALSLEHDVPTENDLGDARARRDAEWQHIRATWLAGDREGAASAGPGLADAFEKSQAQADALADRLRREADRVTRKTEWLAQLDRHRAARTSRAVERDETAARLATLRRDWLEIAAPLGMPAVTPGELRAWLRRRDEVLKLSTQARTDREVREPLEQSRNRHRESLKQALDGLVESNGDAGRLAGWLARAEDVLEREDKTARSRDKLRGQIEDVRAELAREQLDCQAAEDDLTTWRARWAEMMKRLGLDPGASTGQAALILEKTQELFEELQKHRDFQSRIHGIDRDAVQFAADVGALALRVAPDLCDQPAATQARELAQRLRAAREIQARHAIVTQQRETQQRRLRTAEEERDTAVARLESLCAEAGVTTPDELSEAQHRSTERARREGELRDCEDQLLALSGGLDADRFTAEVDQADADALGPSIDRLDHELAALQDELAIVHQTIGDERGKLAAMNGDDRAAAAAEAIQATLARLQGDVTRYATLRLAAAVLKRGIERYREKNQGPVLARAGVLFAGLTGGSFAGLQIDDEGDGPVLKGVRPDGRLVGVGGMSNGSHDQLYLALRLASLESWVEAHEPIPFVVDDILLNFDDQRALAALQALAELSRQTQVLFFTHHRHLVQLAAANLPEDVLFVHKLSSGAATEPASARE
jgi:uncharacterized protein YhaN